MLCTHPASHVRPVSACLSLLHPCVKKLLPEETAAPRTCCTGLACCPPPHPVSAAVPVCELFSLLPHPPARGRFSPSTAFTPAGPEFLHTNLQLCKARTPNARKAARAAGASWAATALGGAAAALATAPPQRTPALRQHTWTGTPSPRCGVRRAGVVLRDGAALLELPLGAAVAVAAAQLSLELKLAAVIRRRHQALRHGVPA